MAEAPECCRRMIEDTARRLQAIQGYAELGLFEEAQEELANLPSGLEMVKALRCDLLTKQSRWEDLRSVAERLARRWPEEPQWWISWAYAVRRAVSVEAARKVLLEAREIHPREAMIAYNLACYASTCGELDMARELLKEAFTISPELKELAVDDDDLKPLFRRDREPDTPPAEPEGGCH